VYVTRRLLTRLRRDERGFTLPELLVAMPIGIIVLLATFFTLDSSVVLTGKVTQRVDRTQRSRAAMDDITRKVRSQVCPVAGTPALISADDYSVRFYAFLGTSPFVPDIREIAWDTNTNSIVERKWAGSGTAPGTSWAATPTTTTLLTDVKPPFISSTSGPRGPIFKYYVGSSQTPLTTPLSAADLTNTSRIGISFMTYAQSTNFNGPGETMQSDVFIRTADPNSTSTTPDCA
jgi:prepilin-type N-terminal cleavage/methylation domain-containing protein